MGLRGQTILRFCFPVYRGAGACGLRKQFMNNYVSPTWACAAGFNNNNNNNIREKNISTAFHEIKDRICYLEKYRLKDCAGNCAYACAMS